MLGCALNTTVFFLYLLFSPRIFYFLAILVKKSIVYHCCVKPKLVSCRYEVRTLVYEGSLQYKGFYHKSRKSLS